MAADYRRVVQVTPVEDRRGLQLGLDRGEVRAAELLPFGDDGERVDTLEGRSTGRPLRLLVGPGAYDVICDMATPNFLIVV